jgi:Coenzyme PQQ synthesis protein D (PqqD)
VRGLDCQRSLARYTVLTAMSSVERPYECNSPGVIFERFEDETVVINLDSGHYYTLDTVGAFVWARLNDAVAVERVIRELQHDFAGDPAAIDASIREFIGLLVSEQLIRPVAGTGGANGTDVQPDGPPSTKGAFRAPELGKYNDMAEMLLLDPVHDVDGAGWPSAPADRTAESPALVAEDDVSTWPELKRDR